MPHKFYDKFLNNGDALDRRRTYRLDREKGGNVKIVVYENITGAPDPPCVAQPDDYNFPSLCTKKHFICGGNTEVEALGKLLEKIKNISFRDLFEERGVSLPEGESDQ